MSDESNQDDDVKDVFNCVFEVHPKENVFRFEISGSMEDVGLLETQILQKDVADTLAGAIRQARQDFHRQQVADLLGEVE